jgi:P-type Cu+ transporter
LENLKPPPISIDISTRHHLIIVKHHDSLTSQAIRDSLFGAGYILDRQRAWNAVNSFNFLRPYTAERRRKSQGQQCHLCQKNEDASGIATPEKSREISSEVFSSNTPTTEKLDELIEVKVERAEDMNRGARRIYLSIGGMTCASCVGTVTEKIEEIAGTSEVAVDLLGKSAAVVIAREELASEVVDIVNDIGFEAELVSSESLVPSGPSAESHSLVRVELDIPGIGSSSLEEIEAAVEGVGAVRLVDVVCISTLMFSHPSH